MTEQRMQFAVGVVTLMAGVALAAIIIWFGEFQFVLQGRTTYYVLFDSAPGIAPQVPVRRAGIRIGEVKNIEYSEKYSLVAVTIALEGNNVLREGDEPTLKRGLLGDTYIEIETRFDMKGKADRTIYEPEKTLVGKSSALGSETIEQAAGLVPSANQVLAEVQATSKEWTQVGQRLNILLSNNEQKIDQLLDQSYDAVDRLNIALQAINSTFDEKAQQDLKASLANMRKMTDDLRPAAETGAKTIDQLGETLNAVDVVIKDLQQITGPLSKRADTMTANFDESAELMRNVLTDVEQLTMKMRGSDGTLQRFLNDPSVYQRLDDASVLLIRNLSQLEKVLRDAQVFTDKIARHPGELGVQGVLTRDTGVKNYVPPTMRHQGQ